GGDEFVVVLSALDVGASESTAQAENVAEKIRSSLSAPYLITVPGERGKAATVMHHGSASIGVALFIDHQTSQDEIIKRADAAMYEAKAAGRNQIRFFAVSA
ncbi:MAG: GGDEF domain-containing protein, partial [Sideroxyarcus sp.]|nr:GGDEF domain-containing protein [Sideroxyarcus sp.]